MDHHQAANKTQHNFIICAWLVNKFGQNFLRQKNGILDIAGGNGLLSYEFSVRYGISSTLYEPRYPIQLNSMSRRKMKRICKNRSTENGSNGTANHCDNETITYSAKSNNMLSKIEMIDQSPMINFLYCNSIHITDDHLILPQVISSIKDGSSLPFTHIPNSFPIYALDIITDIEHANLLNSIQNASMLVGVHADQVTESIIDIAISQQIPFAIVPCCLYNIYYPNRKIFKRLKKIDTKTEDDSYDNGILDNMVNKSQDNNINDNGYDSNHHQHHFTSITKNDGKACNTLNNEIDINLNENELTCDVQLMNDEERKDEEVEEVVPVNGYEDFITYLTLKHANIQQVVLPFSGRNIMLYCTSYHSR